MKKALVALVKVKSILSLGMAFAFIYGFLTNRIESEMFVPLFTMVMVSFFDYQKSKPIDNNKEEE